MGVAPLSPSLLENALYPAGLLPVPCFLLPPAQPAKPPSEHTACLATFALAPAGRLDRKIEFPHPNEEARAKILQVGGTPPAACLHLRAKRRTACVRLVLVLLCPLQSARQPGAQSAIPTAPAHAGTLLATSLLLCVGPACRCSLPLTVGILCHAPCRSTPAR